MYLLPIAPLNVIRAQRIFVLMDIYLFIYYLSTSIINLTQILFGRWVSINSRFDEHYTNEEVISADIWVYSEDQPHDDDC